MSQHGCPERLSNRSKGFAEDGGSQPTMEVLVETLTGTAFEMTVSPSDTIFAIKSKIFRVEGIPVSQQHLLYNLKELEDSSSLCEHAISDGARLRLVLGMRGGPISTRRLPPPAPASSEPWPDIERLLDSNRDEVEWTSGGCKVTVLVFRDGERVNMLRVRDNRDGTYSPLDTAKYSARLCAAGAESAGGGGGGGGAAGAGAGAQHENAVTMGKMLELRRRMESLSLQRGATDTAHAGGSAAPLLAEECRAVGAERAPSPARAAPALPPALPADYTRYEYECSFGARYTLLPPLGAARPHAERAARPHAERAAPAPADADNLQGRVSAEEAPPAEECGGARPEPPPRRAALPAQDYGPLVGAGCAGGGAWRAAHAHSASALQLRCAGGGGVAHAARAPPLEDALFSSSTSDLEKLKRNSRILPALSRARPREHLHLSDEGLHLARELGSERRQRRIDNIAELDARLLRFRDAPAAPAPVPPPPPPPPPQDAKEKKIRVRCGLCARRLSVATVHVCRCGAAYCARHRYAEVHGCAWDYKGGAPRPAPRPAPLRAPKLPEI